MNGLENLTKFSFEFDTIHCIFYSPVNIDEHVEFIKKHKDITLKLINSNHVASIENAMKSINKNTTKCFIYLPV